jgi:hypothetical protein
MRNGGSIALVPVRNREPEGGALADRRLYPDGSAQAFDHFSAERQADATAGVLVATEAAENNENFFRKLRVDADPIVLDREHPFPGGVPRGGDVNLRRLVATVFDGVTDEILEHLDECRLVRPDDGEGIVGDYCAAGRDAFLQVEQRLFRRCDGVGGSAVVFSRSLACQYSRMPLRSASMRCAPYTAVPNVDSAWTSMKCLRPSSPITATVAHLPTPLF